MTISRIAVSSGDPAGIGPDICLKIAQFDHPCEIIVLADPEILRHRAHQLKESVSINLFNPSRSPQAQRCGNITVLPVAAHSTPVCGKLNPKNSLYVLTLIEQAAQGCLGGIFDAMVTAPVHKGIINDAGVLFNGHTEFIAKMTGGHPVMMLSTSGLRVALVTTHLPLSKVSKTISAPLLTRIIETLDHGLQRYFSVKEPKILVCGLNPHAGENGYLGHEEIEIIEPALNLLRTRGFKLFGPLPADSLFTPKYLDDADAVLAMYHDQGLPVLKHMGFGQAVNITLGLSIIRTSVDHGTALDLAGTGMADAGSLQLAINTASTMIENKRNARPSHLTDLKQ